MKIELEVLSLESNAAVVKLPGRQFPGLVLQGDSLKILNDTVEEVIALAKICRNPELDDTAQHPLNMLADYKVAFEEALRANDHPLPY